MSRSRNRIALLVICFLFLPVQFAAAETGILVLHVKDVQRHPIAGVQIGVEGDGGSAVTDANGKARIKLATQTKERSWVSLQIVKSPPGQDLMMVSPWDYKTLVPSFENESENFVEVVVVQRGDRGALESGTVLKAAVSQINKANAPKSADKQTAQPDPKANLEAVAKQFGLSPGDLDKAIKAWGGKTTDPYDAGLAALYERNYGKATVDLQNSLKQREEKLAADQKAVADAAFFLGFSLSEQGKYTDAVAAYRRCLQITPYDPVALNNLALSLQETGDYVEPEALYRRALAIYAITLGPNHPALAIVLRNLAGLLDQRGSYAEAEALCRQALAIDEKAPNHLSVTQDLNGLATELGRQGKYADAEPLYRRALAIAEETLGPNHPAVAMVLMNLAVLLKHTGHFDEAGLLARRAVAIDEKALGPQNPDLAMALSTLGGVLHAEGDFIGAEPPYRQALAIDEKAFGPNHPSIAKDLNNVASVLYVKGDYAGAEALLRRALAIAEKSQPDSPELANGLCNLAELLRRKGDSTGAELLYRRALAIDEKALGPDHPHTIMVRNDLAVLLRQMGKTDEADKLLSSVPQH